MSDKKLDIIDKKLDLVLEKQAELNETQIQQAADLKHHIYRTDQNEELIQNIRTDIVPVKKHVAMVEGGFKLLGMLATFAAFLFGLLEVLADFV